MNPLFKQKKKSPVVLIVKRVKLFLEKFGKQIKKTPGNWLGRLRRRAVIAKMKKGDIILSSPRTTRLSPIALIYRLVLKAQYVHSMLYIGQGKIIHTTSRHGVVIRKVPRKIYNKNKYTIFRVRNLSIEKRDQITAEALRWKGKKLDYVGLITNIPKRLIGIRKIFESWERNRIWCSKLVYHSFMNAGIELVPRQKSENITSEDLAQSPLTLKIRDV